MKRSCLLIIFSFLTLNIYSQQYKVYGKIEDEITKESIAFATIAVKDAKNDSTIVAMITDSKGEFTFECTSGEFNLLIRCVGYKPSNETISVFNQVLYLKAIKLSEDIQVLDEITVSSSSYNEQFDRNVQIVTKQLKESATTVSDLLSKIKGITVNPLTNAVLVNNEENTLLLVNGIKKDQSYIKNLSPERISRIEVTENPTGRYLSDGHKAVINVILKKEYTGYDLYIEEKSLYSLDKSNGDDFLFDNYAYMDFTYTFKKINLYTSYTNNLSNTNLNVESKKRINGNTLIKEPLAKYPNHESKALNHSFLLGSDLFLDSKQALSAEINFKQAPLNNNRLLQSFNNILISNGIENSFESILNTNNYYEDLYTQISYRNKMSKTNNFEFDYSFNNSKSEMYSSYSEDNQNLAYQFINSKIVSSVLEIYFQHSINENLSIESGYKNTYRTYDHLYQSLAQQNIPENTSDIRNLLFSYINITPDSKIKAKIGLAGEQSRINTKDLQLINNSLQPFLTVNYKKSRNLSVTLKVNSESDYPYSEEIRPLESTIDRFSTIIGNPLLKYSTRYTSSLNLSLFRNKISLEPYYWNTRNAISKTGTEFSDHFQYSYSNLDKYESFGIKLSSILPIIPQKMFFNLSGAVYADKVQYDGNDHELLDFTVNANLTYLTPKHKTLYAIMARRMNAKQIQAYGYKNNSNDYMACLIRQPLFKRRVSVTMLYVLPINIGFNYTMDSYFGFHNSYVETNKTDISVLQNLFMLKLTFNLYDGNEIKLIDKKEYKEKRKTKSIFL